MLKYPRTPHLPWSLGKARDDEILLSVSAFEAMSRVVVTEKLDGENTTLCSARCFARSVDSRDHPSRHWIKSVWATVRSDLPQGMRVCGENLYAKHTIHYLELPAYFLVFAVFEGQLCLSWSDTKVWANLLGLYTVPVLYQGPWSMACVQACMTGQSQCGGPQEGYVIRNAATFPVSNFGSNVAKFVRKGHVQTDDHWLSQPMIKNRLKPI